MVYQDNVRSLLNDHDAACPSVFVRGAYKSGFSLGAENSPRRVSLATPLKQFFDFNSIHARMISSAGINQNPEHRL